MVTLRRVSAADVAPLQRDPVDAETLAAAAVIVADVRDRGEAALREHAERLGDLEPGGPLVRERSELEAAFDALSPEEHALLERTRERIASFAAAQLDSIKPLSTKLPGGKAGHYLAPVERAACYAPGGRYPLPSSVLMGVVTARVAGVSEVWVASPKPAPIVLAAAAAAGADGLLAVGGAQAVSALVHGVGPVPACDALVGPGNLWVTAAKQLVAGRVAIDMLAGPSELVVLADDGADPAVVAADLLAQAEHDVEALPVLVSTSSELLDQVDAELAAQLADLPTAETARAAITNGYAVVVGNVDEAIAVCDQLAPEHLQVLTRNAPAVAPRLNHYGALFIGQRSAEVLGDYGAGPNHTLPTGGTARHTGGLSVFTFLRVRTWLHLEDDEAAQEMVQDAARLARLEGLEAHARAAERRSSME